MFALLVVERFARSRIDGWLATAALVFRSVPAATFAASSAPPASSTSTVSAVPAADVSLVKLSAPQRCHGAGAIGVEVSAPLMT